MVSVLAGCTQTCGWFAAIIAVFSWGTFGVPIKSNVNVDVDFFVMQSYKTIVCFVTSWLVILLGEPVRFTPWGIVSGLFWVPGASCGIYAIRNAGIAIAVGTWSSIQVVVSCIFGIIIFQEEVKDRTQTMFAFLVLMIGLIGMSRYSDPSASGKSTDYVSVGTTDPSIDDNTKKASGPMKRKSSKKGSLVVASPIASPRRQDDPKTMPPTPPPIGSTDQNIMAPMEIEENLEVPLLEEDAKALTKDRVILFGGRLVLTKRQMGVLGAVINGAWGGLNLIPLHYAQRDQRLSGPGYLISYASGSMLVCILIWMGLFVYHYVKKGYSMPEALDALPKWHVNELGAPGILAGIFYSVGNFCSILAVSYLGQGVGFSFCQGQLLISGLWGVFYFQEITGRETILKWFASASITIVGIIWLSFQKGGGAMH